MSDRSQAAELGSAAHRDVARQAVAQSEVLLKNDGVLPLSKTASIYVAGSNADDLGNQMGGWTISWQGSSGDTTTGTTIAEGLAEVAPGATITVSEDATAPLAGHDVGVVVVGETPYAEGVGDVGNNGHSLSLKATDQAAIDTVCAAMDCVVLVVAGRTQLVTDRIGEMNGLVASFLPGSEGDGRRRRAVRRPAVHRSPAAHLAGHRRAGSDQRGRRRLRTALLLRLGRTHRRSAGSPRVGARLPRRRGRSGQRRGTARRARLGHRRPDHGCRSGVPLDRSCHRAAPADAANADLVVSLARDLAQAAIADGTAVTGSMAFTADAEHALLTGQPATAVELLARVLGVTVDLPPAVATVTVAAPNKLIAKAGSSVKVAAQVFTADGSTPVGTLTVLDGGTAIATVEVTARDDGRVTVKLPKLPAGLHLISTSFEGGEGLSDSGSVPVPLLLW